MNYVTGDGTVLHNVHTETLTCTIEGCVIHCPTPHHMRDWPTSWRGDKDVMERICPHGVGHPDPDSLDYNRRSEGDEYADVIAVHGCDGCCSFE